MALRLCRIGFHKNIKIQVSSSVKTRHKGDEMILLELGNIESFGRDHWTGVVSQHISNIDAIKRNIDTLEKINVKARLEWFNLNFPKADIIKIEASKMVDKLSGVKDKIDPSIAVTIEAVADIKWE